MRISKLQRLLVRGQVKRADTRDDDRMRLRLALLAGGLASLATNAYVSHRLDGQLKDMPSTPDRSYLQQLIRRANVPRDLPVRSLRGFGNAAYYEPGDYDENDFGGGPYGRVAAERARQYGAVVYDPAFNKPGILAHELGHASMRLAPWYSPSRINQSWLRPAGDALNRLAAPLAGIVAGYTTGKPLAGLGVGLGAGLLTGMPTLINEYQASARGKSYMDRARALDPEVDRKNRKALDTALLTYLGGATVPAAVGGLTAGLLSKSGK